MFNTNVNTLKKVIFSLILLTTLSSCKEEDAKINFKEHSIENSKDAVIALNYPKAEGSESIASRINQVLENHISSQFNVTEDTKNNGSLNDAMNQFNSDYATFIQEFPDAIQKWEALIDGEVTYRSPEIISIAINSYLDTGGAHGNTNVKFFNFDPNTGELFQLNDLISDVKGFSEIVKSKLKTETESSTSASTDNIFLDNDFKLPESIGYSEDGLIILYNPYEITSFAQQIVEFSIPYEEVQQFLSKQ